MGTCRTAIITLVKGLLRCGSSKIELLHLSWHLSRELWSTCHLIWLLHKCRMHFWSAWWTILACTILLGDADLLVWAILEHLRLLQEVVCQNMLYNYRLDFGFLGFFYSLTELVNKVTIFVSWITIFVAPSLATIFGKDFTFFRLQFFGL